MCRELRGWKYVNFPTQEAPKKLRVPPSFPIFTDNRDPKHSQLGEYFLKALKRTELPLTLALNNTGWLQLLLTGNICLYER